MADAGIVVQVVNKVNEGRPHIVDMIKNGEIDVLVNTVDEKRKAIQDSHAIRRSALQMRVPQYTTLAGAKAVCVGLSHVDDFDVYSVQQLHAELKG
ncbi:Carbamoyl-phosphate synthase large chain [compost metagenome]